MYLQQIAQVLAHITMETSGCGLPDPKEAVVEEGEMEKVIGGPSASRKGRA